MPYDVFPRQTSAVVVCAPIVIRQPIRKKGPLQQRVFVLRTHTNPALPHRHNTTCQAKHQHWTHQHAGCTTNLVQLGHKEVVARLEDELGEAGQIEDPVHGSLVQARRKRTTRENEGIQVQENHGRGKTILVQNGPQHGVLPKEKDCARTQSTIRARKQNKKAEGTRAHAQVSHGVCMNILTCRHCDGRGHQKDRHQSGAQHD